MNRPGLTEEKKKGEKKISRSNRGFEPRVLSSYYPREPRATSVRHSASSLGWCYFKGLNYLSGEDYRDLLSAFFIAVQ